MAQFAIPQDDQTELAGPITELMGRLVAVKPLSRETINVKTEYGKSEVLRVRVVDLDTDEDAGVRLLFWSTAQRQILDATAAGSDWCVGTFEQRAQVNDPTRSVYLFTAPDMSEIDPDAISDSIDRAVSPF